MKAIWNDTVIAESDDTVVVEGNHYFPLASVNPELIEDSATTSFCPWKGTAEYFTIKVNDQEKADAAWIYREPKPAASEIKDHVAFWKGVSVSD